MVFKLKVSETVFLVFFFTYLHSHSWSKSCDFLQKLQKFAFTKKKKKKLGNLLQTKMKLKYTVDQLIKSLWIPSFGFHVSSKSPLRKNTIKAQCLTLDTAGPSRGSNRTHSDSHFETWEEIQNVVEQKAAIPFGEPLRGRGFKNRSVFKGQAAVTLMVLKVPKVAGLTWRGDTWEVLCAARWWGYLTIWASGWGDPAGGGRGPPSPPPTLGSNFPLAAIIRNEGVGRMELLITECLIFSPSHFCLVGVFRGCLVSFALKLPISWRTACLTPVLVFDVSPAKGFFF